MVSMPMLDGPTCSIVSRPLTFRGSSAPIESALKCSEVKWQETALGQGSASWLRAQSDPCSFPRSCWRPQCRVVLREYNSTSQRKGTCSDLQKRDDTLRSAIERYQGVTSSQHQKPDIRVYCQA